MVPHGRRSLMELLAASGTRIESDCGGAGTCGKCCVHVTTAAHNEEVLACQYVPSAVVAVTLPRALAFGSQRQSLPSRPRQRKSSTQRLALAADVGTTTISLAAVDLGNGRVVHRRDELNPQMVYGADVMSRIAAGQRARQTALTSVLAHFMAERGIGSRRPVVVVGNTVMTHFLLGRDPAGLGELPYRSRLPLGVSLAGHRGAIRLRVLPLLGRFVGSDCTAAILASGMHRSPRLSLLVDAGTNGEVVLGNRERMLVCSTAAGPAFEGATIECGGLARPGAIRSVELARGRIRVTTVRSRVPSSICGSGVLDAVAVGLETCAIHPSGRLNRGARRFVLTTSGSEPVYLSQGDVREVQLAKAAIAAGIRLLLAEWGAKARDIERLFITGKFGAAMNPSSAMRIGLLPTVPRSRFRRHSNLALAGAVGAIRQPCLFAEAEELAAHVSEVVLSGQEHFEKAFIDSMELAAWQ